jgi:hypothetical protein
MDEENGMSGINVAAVGRIVANTIVETARGDRSPVMMRLRLQMLTPASAILIRFAPPT